jgi:hypothetical protein
MAYDNMLFTPRRAGTTAIAATTSSSSTQVRAAAAVPNFPQNLRIFNAGAVTVYVETGDANTVAVKPSGGTLGAMPIAAGQTIGIGLKAGDTHVAVLTDSSTATVFVTPGEGL